MKKLPNKNLIIALLLAVANLIGIFLIFGETQNAETNCLIQVMSWLEGKQELVWQTIGYALLYRPLAPLLAVPFGLFLGEQNGLLMINIIFYLLCVYLIFKITYLIYENEKQALLASLLFAFAIATLRNALSAHATDTGSWFFCILSVYLTLLYLKKRQEKIIIWNGLIAGLGMLMKESGGLGILFFIAIIPFLKEFNFKTKIRKLIKFGIFFLMPIIFFETVVTVFFAPFSHLDYFLLDYVNYVKKEPSVIFYILQHLLALLTTFGFLGWLLIFFGAFKEWQNRNQKRIKILLALVPFSLVSWLWITGDSRHAFVVGTLGALLGSYGLINLEAMIKNKKLAISLTISVVSLYIVLNYLAYYFNDSLPFLEFKKIFSFLVGS